MARRAVKRAPSEESSELSPPPADVEPSKPATNESKKRKRTTTTGPANGDGTPVKAEEEQVTIPKTSPETPKRIRKRKAVEYKEQENDVQAPPDEKPEEKPSRRKKTKLETIEIESVQQNGQTEAVAVADKVKKKRKTKEEKEAEAMPLAARTIGHKLFIGAHVSSAGGVPNAATNAVHIGANAFALFLKSQRKWANPPLIDGHCASWHANCSTHSYNANKHVVPHGSYLVNLAHTDPARTTQAYDVFIDDLRRCERLGIGLYNFHPGNTAGSNRLAGIAHLASNLNRAHKETSTVVTLLENMAAGGNTLGSTFEDLAAVIDLVDDKTRVGVCLDTCHALAAGYDLRTPDALQVTLSHFDETIGIKYLRAVHLNDSKAPLGSHRDLHANIGTGFLGLRAFHGIVNDARFEGLPLVLETPIEVRNEDGVLVKDEKGKEKEDKGVWAREIKMLEGLVGMDVESEEFVAMEMALQRRGAGERARVAEQVARREDKAKEKVAKGKGKKKGKKKGDGVQSEEFSLSELDEEEQ